MPNKDVELDRIFMALADPTRRAVIRQLSDGAAAVSILAEPFDMALHNS
jgi:DNA-binding transcriptional ArsR family regulator